jgi:hypothetical protein
MADLSKLLQQKKDNGNSLKDAIARASGEKSEGGAGKPAFLSSLGNGIKKSSSGTEQKPVSVQNQSASNEAPSKGGFTLNIPAAGAAASTQDRAASSPPKPYDAVPAVGVVGANASPAAPAVVIDAATYNHPSQPDALTEEAAKQFREALDVLKNSFDHKELVGNAIKHALNILKKHPQFRTILAPEDCQLMVRSLRASYGFAVTVKTEKKEKKQTKAKQVDEVTKLLDEVNFTL